MIVAVLLLCSGFLSKTGVPFELSWERKIEEPLLERLTVSSFLESYRQSGAFEHLSDGEIKAHLAEYCQAKRFSPSNQMITAWQGETLAGLAIFEEQDPETVYLAEVMIDPQFWGQGLGTELIFSILKEKPEVKRITLIAEKANTKTLRFYQSLGFSSQESQSDYITFNYLR